MTFNRRHVLQLGLLSTLGLAANRFQRKANAESSDAHYFLHVQLDGGFDCSNLYDARPLAMTQANYIHNYFGIEPTRWTDARGCSTFVPASAAALAPLRDRFSLINGIHMGATDGHDQNLNYLQTGNIFGGEYFVPHLNEMQPLPIDFIMLGERLYESTTNAGNGVLISPTGLAELSKKAQEVPAFDNQNPATKYVIERFSRLSGSTTHFGDGSRLMATNSERVPQLAQVLSRVSIDTTIQDATELRLQFIAEVFRKNLTRSLRWVIKTQLDIDSHNFDLAQKQPETATDIAQHVAKILNFLSSTPFDTNRSLLDVTTVLVASEFGRTMRQLGVRIDATGTDHNEYTNSFLVAGKNIRGGLIVGASDFATPDEQLSNAHLSIDEHKLKSFGRPFDFSRGIAALDARPEEYKANDYLNCASVVNTLYSAFGAPVSRHRAIGNDGVTAPVISSLLS